MKKLADISFFENLGSNQTGSAISFFNSTSVPIINGDFNLDFLASRGEPQPQPNETPRQKAKADKAARKAEIAEQKATRKAEKRAARDAKKLARKTKKQTSQAPTTTTAAPEAIQQQADELRTIAKAAKEKTKKSKLSISNMLMLIAALGGWGKIAVDDLANKGTFFRLGTAVVGEETMNNLVDILGGPSENTKLIEAGKRAAQSVTHNAEQINGIIAEAAACIDRADQMVRNQDNVTDDEWLQVNEDLQKVREELLGVVDTLSTTLQDATTLTTILREKTEALAVYDKVVDEIIAKKSRDTQKTTDELGDAQTELEKAYSRTQDIPKDVNRPYSE